MNFVELGGLTFHYRLDGIPDNPALVFINSLGTDLRCWSRVVPHFEDRYALITYDKRGHGLTDSPDPPYTIRQHADDLSLILDNFGLRHPVLVGISVGGMIALDYAARHPDRIAGLVLCDTYPKIGTSELWNERIAGIQAQGMAELAGTIIARWFDPAYPERDAATYGGYLNMLERTPLTGYIGTCEAIRDADLRSVVKHITAPTLVLCGENDLATPPDLVRSLAEEIAGAQFSLIEEAGHLPCVEQPEIVSRVIRDFLTGMDYG